MTSLNRLARFELLLAILAVIAVMGLFLWSRNVMVANAGFAILGISGVRAAVQAARGDRGEGDEREAIISQRATVAGYTALWLALVAWGVTVTLKFGGEGSVPLALVAPVLWVAWWLVSVVRSITILILERYGV